MRYTDYISSNEAIAEWKSRVKPEQEGYDEEDIRGWVDDIVKAILPSSLELYTHQIALLEVSHYMAEIPKNFRKVCLMGCLITPHKKQKCHREQLVSWTQKAYGTECELEIDLKCPDCYKVEDGCSAPIIEVDVDRIWEMANPQYDYMYQNHFLRWSKFGDGCHFINPEFRAMCPAKKGKLHAYSHHIPNCLNLECETEHTYRFDSPSIVVNFKQGQLLLSYLALKTDEDGYALIPDNYYLIEAIIWGIESRLAYISFRDDISPRSRKEERKFAIADQKYKESFRMARAKLKSPKADMVKSIAQNVWLKRLRDPSFGENPIRYPRNRK